MIKRKWLLLPVASLMLLLAWLLWPVYQFFAYSKGAVPLPPLGWLEMPPEAPSVQELRDPVYAEAASLSLRAIEKHRQKIASPAIGAAVAQCGKVVWAGAAGWENVESKTPATPATRFRIGSTSKALTATALARLVQSGRMQLDTPISEYLQPLPNPAWEKLTPRQLASHMAGMPEYKENRDWDGLYHTLALRKHYDNMVDALEVFDETPLVNKPGTEFHYSTFDTVLLGATIGAVEQQSYLQVLRKQVFEPAGMSATIVAPVGGDSRNRIATPYRSNRQPGDAHRLRPWRDVDLSHRLPGGGFVSTPTELVQFGSLYFDDDYLAPEVRAQFWTPQKTASGDINPQKYALGWRIAQLEVPGVGAVPNANHGGVSRGGQSWLMLMPDYKMAIAVNINRKTGVFWDFGRISERIAAEFIRAGGGSCTGTAALSDTGPSPQRRPERVAKRAVARL
ncbi:serine hydrolase domain-containing protein [Microbulbifer halophilus]|uniref:Serine hydrolase domain-containing protein n=1 Tax=Microbulbifer halophilus TaxID=453963 RepID=A0ABW5E8I6_9GAMM|nr:serine hydrolase domain-containing protein [Microbulbifer halophilus]MCW8125368.1 serine hydrolase [Microbulbifer halophilus]